MTLGYYYYQNSYTKGIQANLRLGSSTTTFSISLERYFDGTDSASKLPEELLGYKEKLKIIKLYKVLEINRTSRIKYQMSLFIMWGDRNQNFCSYVYILIGHFVLVILH